MNLGGVVYRGVVGEPRNVKLQFFGCLEESLREQSSPIMLGTDHNTNSSTNHTSTNTYIRANNTPNKANTEQNLTFHTNNTSTMKTILRAFVRIELMRMLSTGFSVETGIGAYL